MMAADQRPDSNSVNPAILSWLQNALRPAYQDQSRTFNDVSMVLNEYKSIRLKTEVFTYPSGQTRLLLVLHGTIPIDFRTKLYNIPLNIWLSHDYPKSAPMVFVVPSSGMGVRTSNHVDIDRRCYHPYLAYWTNDPERSVLVMAIRHLQDVFSRDPPLYTISHEAGHNRWTEQMELRTSVRPASLTSGATETRALPPRPAKLPQENISAGIESLAGQQMSTVRKPPALPPPPPVSFRMQNHTDERPGSASSTHQAQQAIFMHSRETKKETRPQLSVQVPVHKHLDRYSSNTDQRTQDNLLLSRIYMDIGHRRDDDWKRYMSEVYALEKSNDNVAQRIETFKNFEQQLQRLNSVTSSNSSTLSDKLQKARSVIESSSQEDLKNLGQLVVAQNVVYNQLYELVADEMGLEDTIYALGKAFEVERIDLDVFLKHVRSLAREQFMQRALIAKISKTLNLQL